MGKIVCAAMIGIIKSANKSISRLRSINYPMTLSPNIELEFKNKDMFWVCKKKFAEGSGEMSVHAHDYLSNPFLSKRGGG